MSSWAPWHSHYDADVPTTLAPYPRRTLIDYLADSARERPRDTAILFKGAKVTNGELEWLSNRLAAAFDSLGVKRGDRLALLLPNCPQFFIAQFAAWKLGAIVAPFNPMYTEHELAPLFVDHGIETIVTLTRFDHRVKRIQRQTSIKRVIATHIKEFFPPGLRLLFTLFRERKDGDRVTLASGDYRFHELLTSTCDPPRPREPVTGDDPAVLLMSGGTTGTPKGVLGRHSAYVLSGLQAFAWVRSVLTHKDDVIFVPLPLFHVYANVGVQGMAFVNGNPIAVLPNPRDIADVIATIRRVKPTFFNGVPTLFMALMNHPAVQDRKVDFTSIKICFSGAAPLLADTKLRFESMTGGRIVEGYSLTEAMMALCINPVLGANKIGSVGLPLPDINVRIFDGDEGVRVMPAGEMGEIAFSAPQLMAGYWNRPDETAGILRDHVDHDGIRRWLHTGDLGYMDTDGYVFIVDRKKDLIKTSGFQVWPREVEEVLSAHPAVAEVGVAGVSDTLKGEVVKAWVVVRANHATTEHELRSFCREKLTAYKVPSYIEFRTELPKTMVGKVLRRALRETPQ
jgi:long-chain acyl-CoA synthetase